MTGNCETMGHCAFNILFTKSVPHILEKIFLSLDYESFKNCMEVSKTWRSLLASERIQLMGESMFFEELQRDLWQASQWGHSKEVRKILTHFLVNIHFVGGKYQETSLSAASSMGHKEVVHLLLDKGADPNHVDITYGCTPLHWAACHGHKGGVQLLLDRGADPKAQSYEGNTALHKAAAKGQKEVVQLLLERGGNPKTQNNAGYTTLHGAAARGKKEVVQLLLDRGADPKAQSITGNTALHMAASCCKTDLVQ